MSWQHVLVPFHFPPSSSPLPSQIAATSPSSSAAPSSHHHSRFRHEIIPLLLLLLREIRHIRNPVLGLVSADIHLSRTFPLLAFPRYPNLSRCR
jgi:hypothetical protein